MDAIYLWISLACTGWGMFKAFIEDDDVGEAFMGIGLAVAIYGSIVY